MDRLQIRGGLPLHGTVAVQGSKNTGLALLAGTLLLEGESVLTQLPRVSDIEDFRAIMAELGVASVWEAEGTLRVSNHGLLDRAPAEALMRRLRASFYVMGPLLARHRRARVPLPGGCTIGSRPVDLHLKAFAALGARIRVEAGCAQAEARRLRGAAIYLNGPFGPSVGATVAAILAAATAPGVTQIHCAAREPEVVELAAMLNRAGARIAGAGTATIEVEGVPALRGVRYQVPGDRIVAGTLLLAGAATGGDVTVTGLPPGHLGELLPLLGEMGCAVETVTPAQGGADHSVRVAAGLSRLRAVSAVAAPFPGLATDLQPPLVAALCRAEGVSLVAETVFDGRFGYLAELQRFGARVRAEGSQAIVTGVPELTGAAVQAGDLRAAAALVIAGLMARGETVVEGLEHLDRGHSDLDGILRRLGAQVERVSYPAPDPGPGLSSPLSTASATSDRA